MYVQVAYGGGCTYLLRSDGVAVRKEDKGEEQAVVAEPGDREVIKHVSGCLDDFCEHVTLHFGTRNS